MKIVTIDDNEVEVRGFDGQNYKIILIQTRFGKIFTETKQYNTLPTDFVWKHCKGDTLRPNDTDVWALKRSITEDLLADPIKLMDAGCMLVEGWCRLKAFHELGLPLIPFKTSTINPEWRKVLLETLASEKAKEEFKYNTGKG